MNENERLWDGQTHKLFQAVCEMWCLPWCEQMNIQESRYMSKRQCRSVRYPPVYGNRVFCEIRISVKFNPIMFGSMRRFARPLREPFFHASILSALSITKKAHRPYLFIPFRVDPPCSNDDIALPNEAIGALSLTFWDDFWSCVV